MKNEKEIRYIDLFGGVGGFRLGIERAEICNGIRKSEKGDGKSKTSIKSLEKCNESSRFKGNSTIPNRRQKKFYCVWYNDFDKYAVQTYNKNFKENWEAKDIRTIKTSKIPDFDLLCAGFPCQAFSIAGKRKGFEDTRGTLFYEIARILKAKRPKYFLLENVKGLLSHDRGRIFAIILSTLAELGYDVQWMVLNSKFFGVPQNRERVFIIGSIRGESRPEILPFGESKEFFDKEKRGEQEKEKRICSTIDSRYGALRNAGETYLVHNVYGGFKEKKMRKFKETRPTIRTPKGGGHLPMVMNTIQEAVGTRGGSSTSFKKSVKNINESIGQVRRLTPIECERLQGFPDNWTEGVSDTQRYKQMGNAVTVNVIQAIISKLLVRGKI